MSARRLDGYQEPPEDTIANVEPDGTPPEERVCTVDAARSIYEDCVLDSEPQSKVRARIRGIVDGNPPYDPAELRRVGQAWRTNFNAREAEAIIDTNSSALWEMQHDTFVVARFCAVDPEASYSPDNGLDYGDILSQEYSRVLKDWPDWPVYTDLTIHDVMESGMGVMMWPDETCVKPKWYNISNFTFPKTATCSIDDLEFYFLRDEMPLHRIFSALKNEKAAEAEGWNVEATKQYLIYRFGYGESEASSSTEDQYRMSGWEAVQQMIKNNDAGVQRMQFEGVKVVRMFVREIDSKGGITQLIFVEEPVSSKTDNKMRMNGSEDESSYEDSFLFKKSRQFKKMSECLWWVLYSYGDGYLTSVKGLGHRITPHCEVSNRLICSTFDTGMLSSSLLLQPASGVDFSKMAIMRVGPFTYIPENVAAVQTSYNPKIDGLLLLRDMSSSILNNNTGVFRTRNENPLRSEGDKTARQVMSEESKEARFEKNQAAFFYAQWDLFHQEFFRRLCSTKTNSSFVPKEDRDIAKDFRDRCVARGVPETMMTAEQWEVRAERAIGLGSAGMRLDVTQQLLSVLGMMPEENQIHAKREFAAARVGAQHVDRFFPLKPRSMFASDSASIATLENNDFNEGGWVPAGSDQLHAVHLPIHFTPLLQIEQTFSDTPDQVDARQAFMVFSVAMPHIQQHLGFMANDHLPTDNVRHAKFVEYLDLYKKLREFVGRLEGVLEQQKRAEENAQKRQAEEIQKLKEEADAQKFAVEKYRIDQDAALKKYEADLLHQSRISKTQTGNEAMTQKTVTDIVNKARVTEAEISAIVAKTIADISVKQSKSKTGE